MSSLTSTLLMVTTYITLTEDSRSQSLMQASIVASSTLPLNRPAAFSLESLHYPWLATSVLLSDSPAFCDLEKRLTPTTLDILNIDSIRQNDIKICSEHYAGTARRSWHPDPAPDLHLDEAPKFHLIAIHKSHQSEMRKMLGEPPGAQLR